MTLLYRIIRGIVFIYAYIVYKIKIIGLENVPKNGGAVICANHQSFNDVILLAVATKRQLHFMGKEELFKIKPIAYLFKKLGAFPVKRRKGDVTAVEQAKDVVKSGKLFMIFPEGTRTNGEMIRAKSGAALVASSCESDIIPVAIKYSNKKHFFCNATLSFGKPFSVPKVDMENGGRKTIREVSDKIMSNIKELYDKI